MLVYCSLHKLEQDTRMIYSVPEATTDDVEPKAVFIAGDHG